MKKVIGIDLGGTKIKAGIVSDNKLLKVVSKDINSNDTMLGVVKQIENVIDELFDKEIAAIGIGVPAIVDLKKGIVYEVTFIPSWKKVPLKSLFEKKYKVSVIVNNDAKCFTLGEKYFGECKKVNNFVGMTFGTGLGGGIVINGKLYSGINCGAGEFGNILYKDSNLELQACGNFYKKLGLSGKELSKKAREGDKKSLEIFKEQGYHIGKAVADVVNAIDPEVVILGGSITNDFEFWKDSMINSVKESVYQWTFSKLKIKVSKNKDIAVLGAASLYYDSKK